MIRRWWWAERSSTLCHQAGGCCGTRWRDDVVILWAWKTLIRIWWTWKENVLDGYHHDWPSLAGRGNSSISTKVGDKLRWSVEGKETQISTFVRVYICQPWNSPGWIQYFEHHVNFHVDVVNSSLEMFCRQGTLRGFSKSGSVRCSTR